MDRHFAWESEENDPRSVAGARYRIEADVTGNRASGFLPMLKIPESYERARARRTSLWGIALALIILGAGGLVSFAVRDAAQAHMSGDIPWKKLIPAGPIAMAFALIGMLGRWPDFVSQYTTTVPWGSYMVMFSVAVVASVVAYFLMAWAGLAVARGLQPRVARLADAGARRRMIPGALVVLILAPAWVRILSLAERVLLARFPGSTAPPGLSAGVELGTLVPGLAVGTDIISATFLFVLGIAVTARVLTSREWPGRRLRVLAPCLLALGVALLPARAPGEAVVNLVRIAVGVALVWGLLAVARGNPLAVIAGAYGFNAVGAVAWLVAEPDAWVRGQGILAAILLLLPILGVLVSAFRRGRTTTT